MNQGLRIAQEHVPPDMVGFDILDLGLGDLLPVALVCGLSVLFMLLWLLAVTTLWRRGRWA
jgi:hypothetical protein